MSDIMRIDLGNLNNKSIDIISDIALSENTNFYLKSIDDENYKSNTLINVVTFNGILPFNENRKTLLLDNLLQRNKSYTVTIKDIDLSVNESIDFTFVDFPRITADDVKLDVIGDRILKISFPYPVSNLNATILSGGKLSLANFYAVFYDLDSNLSTIVSSGNAHYPGTFHYEDGNSVRVAKDLRSIEIQNAVALPNGDHRLFINFNKDHDGLSFIKDFSDIEKDGRRLPVIEKRFTIETKAIKTTLVELKAIDRTTVLAKFNNNVLLDENEYDDNNVLGIYDAVSNKIKTLDLIGEKGFLKIIYLTSPAGLQIDVSNNDLNPNTPPSPNVEPAKKYNEIFPVIINKVLDADEPYKPELLSKAPIERNGINFNELIFHLKPNSDNAIPIGISTLQVQNIRDAYGSIIDTKSYQVNVENKPPRLISVKEYPADTEDYSQFDFIFSEVMNGNMVSKLDYYSISDINGNKVEINKVEADGNDDKKEYKIKIYPKLASGSYWFNVKGIMNTLDTPMVEFNEIVEVTDTTVPVVERILVIEKDPGPGSEDVIDKTNNVIIIEFNEPMNVSGEHSVKESFNYRYICDDDFVCGKDPKTKVPLTELTVVENLDIYNKRFRMIISPEEFKVVNTATLPYYKYNEDNTLIGLDIGYCKPTEIKFVTNASKNILPICKTHEPDEIVKRINLNNATIEITSENTLSCGADLGLNEFETVNQDDFLFKMELSTELLKIKEVVIDEKNKKKLNFTFENKPFVATTKKIYMGVKVGKTQDIFLQPLIEVKDGDNLKAFDKVRNMIPTVLQGVSLLSEGKIAVVFNQKLGFKSKDDFELMDTRTAVRVPITSAKINTTNNMMLELHVTPNTLSTALNSYKLRVVKDDPKYIVTADTDGEPINVFPNTNVEVYKVNDFAWNLSGNTIDVKNHSFTITFDKDINPTAPLRGELAAVVFQERDVDAEKNAYLDLGDWGKIEFIGIEQNGAESDIFQSITTNGKIKVENIQDNEIKISFTSLVDTTFKANLVLRAFYVPKDGTIKDETGSYYISDIESPNARAIL